MRAKSCWSLAHLTSGSKPDAAHPSRDCAGHHECFTLGAGGVCLVGENTTCPVPASWGCEGVYTLEDHGYVRNDEYTPSTPRAPAPRGHAPINSKVIPRQGLNFLGQNVMTSRDPQV